MKKLFYVILSSGAYSDYSPIFFVGEKEITQEKFDKKGREVGDLLIDSFEKLPQRASTNPFNNGEREGDTAYSPSFCEWEPIMTKWLLEEMEYKKLPLNIPEINIEYSSVPSNYNL